MNLLELTPVEELAVDIVVQVVNTAKAKVGCRMNLAQLANSHKNTAMLVSLQNLGVPLGRTTDKFLTQIIEKQWQLNRKLMYVKRYMGSSHDEVSHYYYYEVVFSQPTILYPIPQATATVYFRIADKHINSPNIRIIPKMVFRIEGQHADHDVRFVTLTVDWILAVIQMKIKLYQRIENMGIF